MAHKKAEDDDWNLCESYRICELKLHREKRECENMCLIRMALNEIFMCRGLNRALAEVAGRHKWADAACVLMIWTIRPLSLAFSAWHIHHTTRARSSKLGYHFHIYFVAICYLLVHSLCYSRTHLCHRVHSLHSRIFGLRVCMNVKLNLRLINMQFMLVFIGRFVRYPSRRLYIWIVSQSQSSPCYGCWLSGVTWHLSKEAKQCEKMAAVRYEGRGKISIIHPERLTLCWLYTRLGCDSQATVAAARWWIWY